MEQYRRKKLKLPTKERLKSVVIDPAKMFPDMNFSNNEWLAK